MGNMADIKEAENEIDAAFSSNKLKDIGYAQAVWTLLSVVEDFYLKITMGLEIEGRVIPPLPGKDLRPTIDSLINELSYPLRICFKEAEKNKNELVKEYIDEQYGLAAEWLKESEDYHQFNIMFPLWHREEINLSTSGEFLVHTDRSSLQLEYEAYNRLVKKTGYLTDTFSDYNKATIVKEEIVKNTSFKETTFKVNFNPKLASQLIAFRNETLSSSYSLPESWEFSSFTLSQFKSVYIATNSLIWAWFIARIAAISDKNIQNYGYCSSVWVVQKEELVNRIVKYSKQTKEIVIKIYDMITFGNAGIKNPDVAIQPLLDLHNGCYALSPFVWLNTDSERNLCVLLNQIEAEKKIYSKLVDEKESTMRNEIKDIITINSLPFECKHGEINGTDVDLAIIDRKNKACITLELKWFIEPAEIREIINRTKELKKGVCQAKRIKEAYEKGDNHLIKSVLAIESDYNFLAIVGSHNWIGFSDIQDSDVAIIKVGDFMSRLETSKNLKETISWLNDRHYLPKRGDNFEVKDIDIKVGKWKSKWYGIKPL